MTWKVFIEEGSKGVILHEDFVVVVTTELSFWLRERDMRCRNQAIYSKTAYGVKKCIGYQFTFHNKKDAIWFRLAWG